MNDSGLCNDRLQPGPYRPFWRHFAVCLTVPRAEFNSKATTQGDALAAAEQSFIARDDDYSHPYYWAAFLIVGDGGRPLPDATQPAQIAAIRP